MQSILIPKTSKTQYLSGKAALNLISDEGTGDWHIHQTFFKDNGKRGRSFIAGEGQETNTLWLLGDIGIFDCTDVLKRMKIRHVGERAWSANHARAIVDMLLSSLFRNKSMKHITLHGWMPDDEHKKQVFDMIDLAFNQLSDEQRKLINDWKTWALSYP